MRHLFLVGRRYDEHDFECVRRRTDEIVEKLGHEKHSLIVMWALFGERRWLPTNNVTECIDVQVHFQCYSNLPEALTLFESTISQQ